MLFGALLVAALLDTLFPGLLHGIAGVLVVGVFSYVAAQEWCEKLGRRGLWNQESLATSLALCVGGFLYYWNRNGSDFVMVVLSIGLMMASLMIAIAFIAAVGAAFRERSAQPILGLILTTFGALFLGIAGGLLTLSTPLLLLVAALGLVAWKLRESVRPPGRAATLQTSGETPRLALHPVPMRWLPSPQRGTLLDRFVPVLLLGVALFLLFYKSNPSSPLAIQTPASAASSNSAPR